MEVKAQLLMCVHSAPATASPKGDPAACECEVCMPSLQVTMRPVPRCATGDGGKSGPSQKVPPPPGEAPHRSSGGSSGSGGDSDGGHTGQEDGDPLGPSGAAGRPQPAQGESVSMPAEQVSGPTSTSLPGVGPAAASGASDETEGLAVRSEKRVGPCNAHPAFITPTHFLHLGGGPRL